MSPVKRWLRAFGLWLARIDGDPERAFAMTMFPKKMPPPDQRPLWGSYATAKWDAAHPKEAT